MVVDVDSVGDIITIASSAGSNVFERISFDILDRQ